MIEYQIDAEGIIARATADSEFICKQVRVVVPRAMTSVQAARLLRRLANEMEAEAIRRGVG